MNPHLTPRGILHSASLYPHTLVFVCGVIVIECAVNWWLTVPQAILIFGVIVVVAIVWSAYRELVAVHKLVDGQRDELVLRIDRLTGLMINAGIAVPAQGRKEQDARDDIRRAQTTTGTTRG